MLVGEALYIWIISISDGFVSRQSRSAEGRRRRGQRFLVVLGFCYLDGLDGALDLAGSAEDAVILPGRVGFPRCQWGFSAIIGDALVHFFLFSRQLHSVEDVDWADGNADTIGNANIKVHAHGRSVNTILLTNSIFPLYLVVNVSLLYRPPVREARVLNQLSNVGHDRVF